MRNFEMNKLLVLTLGVFVAACSERPTEPGSLSSPAFAIGGAAACPTQATVVVTDEASLLAALSAASPGDVIGIDGLIAITDDIFIDTEELTLTCATSGSGLVAQPGVDDMVRPTAKGVRVERLILAGASSSSPYLAINDGVTTFAEEVRLSNNIITCGRGTCAFFVGVANARVFGNHFESSGSVTGVHLQGSGPVAPDGSRPRPIDGTRVEHNTIVATAPSTISSFGGIRARDGRDVVISNNEVRGPWANSIAAIGLVASRITRNHLRDPVLFGVRVRATGSAVGNNRATGAGVAGVVARGCENAFLGNDLRGNADNTGAIFDEPSGNNVLVGNGANVIDNGDFDCDGDGTPDPNIITGRGAVLNGVNLGEIISDAVVSSSGIVIR